MPLGAGSCSVMRAPLRPSGLRLGRLWGAPWVKGSTRGSPGKLWSIHRELWFVDVFENKMMNSTLSLPSICLFGTLSKFQGRLQTRSDRIDIFTWWSSQRWHRIFETYRKYIALIIKSLPCSTGWLLWGAALMGCLLPCHSVIKCSVNKWKSLDLYLLTWYPLTNF